MHTLIIFAASYLVFLPVPVIAYLELRSLQRRHYELLVVALLLSFYVLLLARLGTTLIHDPRPFVRDGVTPLIHSATDNGFPSDHTLLASLLACIGWHANRKLGLALAVVAIVVGWGRVAAGVHHIQDVIGGMLIVLVAYGLVLLSLRLYRGRQTAAADNKLTNTEK